MNAISSTPSSRINRRQTRLVIVRANGPLFYSIALASFLETDAGHDAARLLECLGRDEVLGEWLRAKWIPLKQARASALRQYVERCWPEFDWAGAYDHYRGSIAQHGAATPYRATAGREALARCVSACQAGLYYRALARWSDDHELRALAPGMGQEEAAAFERFRTTFDRRAPREGLGLLASWRIARACVRHARDTHVRLAFEALNAYCGLNAPFPVLDYSQFLRRMQAVIDRCAAPIWSERLLFRAWRRAPRITAEQTRRPAAGWFRPVLSQAA